MVEKYLVEGHGNVFVVKHNLKYFKSQSVNELSIISTINDRNYKFLLNYHI